MFDQILRHIADASDPAACWLWTGAGARRYLCRTVDPRVKEQRDYYHAYSALRPRIKGPGRKTYHPAQLLWMLEHGLDAPPSLKRVCSTQLCVNPDHFELRAVPIEQRMRAIREIVDPHPDHGVTFEQVALWVRDATNPPLDLVEGDLELYFQTTSPA